MTDLNPLGSTGSGVETAAEGRAMAQVHTGTPSHGAGRARHRASPGTKVLVYGVLLFFALLYLYPFAIQLVTALKTAPDAVANPMSFVPDPFSTAAFSRLFETDFTLWFANSVVVSLCVTAGRVFFDSLAGYALARMRFRGRVGVFNAVIAVMAVPGVVLLIPKFLVLNYLGIYNTYPALFLPLIADAAGVFIMKQFFETIPVSVEEAARIDGAGPFRTFWSVVLPMAKPALITLTILSFQSSWNELGHFIIATNDPQLYTLTRGVAGLTSGGLGAGNQFPIRMAAALLMTIPTAAVFVVFQRFFTQGANVGAEKG